MLLLLPFFCFAGTVVSVLGWSLHRRADPDSTLPLSIALSQSNIDKLEEYLLDIADPNSPNYGKHWTPAQVRDTFRPSQESVDVVHAWLATDGVHPERVEYNADGIHLRVNVSVSEAERLLATEYYVYQHEDGTEHLACQYGYHLPEHVSRHVELVKPTIQFAAVRPSRPTFLKRADPEVAPVRRSGLQRPKGTPKYPINIESMNNGTKLHCDEQITLDCIRALYDFRYDLKVPHLNSIGVVELGGQNYNAEDLDIFFEKFAPGRVGHRPTLMSLDGGIENVNATKNIAESNLDFQLIMGLLGAQQRVYLYQIGDGFVDDLLSAFDTRYCKDINGTACNGKMKTSVVSISYGDAELPSEKNMVRQCNELGKLSLTGVTFVYASGDSGPSFRGVCLATNGSLKEGVGNFIPDFPSTCPYVTAVGATQVNSGSSISDPESATAGFASGGGFSNVFPRPRFQDHHVQKYLKDFAPPYGPNVYNRSGRAYPDIAANGLNITIVEDGQFTKVGGTSASAPIFAAMLTAVNDARIASGKSTVGWINPALYSHLFANVWNDITDGSNPACGTIGFPTAPGWDPVTGLGTPNFPRLLARFMDLP